MYIMLIIWRSKKEEKQKFYDEMVRIKKEQKKNK